MCKKQENLEEFKKFNNFLNKTIIGLSKDFYRKELRNKRKELTILDTEEFEDDFEKYLKYNEVFLEIQSAKNAIDFINYCDNADLYNGLKSLSAIEQSVIFLFFGADLSNEGIAEVLNIHKYSVSRIKSRALDKLRKILKDGDLYE